METEKKMNRMKLFFFFLKKTRLEESVSQSGQFLFVGGDGGSELKG